MRLGHAEKSRVGHAVSQDLPPLAATHPPQWMECPVLADDVLGKAHRRIAEAGPLRLRIGAVYPTERAIGLESQPHLQFRARFVEHFLQAGNTPVLLLAHPRQAEERAYVAAWMAGSVHPRAVPDSSIPGKNAPRRNFNLDRHFSRRRIYLVFRFPAMTARDNERATALRREIIEQPEKITCRWKIGGGWNLALIAVELLRFLGGAVKDTARNTRDQKIFTQHESSEFVGFVALH